MIGSFRKIKRMRRPLRMTEEEEKNIDTSYKSVEADLMRIRKMTSDVLRKKNKVSTKLLAIFGFDIGAAITVMLYSSSSFYLAAFIGLVVLLVLQFLSIFAFENFFSWLSIGARELWPYQEVIEQVFRKEGKVVDKSLLEKSLACTVFTIKRTVSIADASIEEMNRVQNIVLLISFCVIPVIIVLLTCFGIIL